MIFNTIIKRDKNLEGFISCPLGQSFSDRNFCWNLFPTKRRLLYKSLMIFNTIIKRDKNLEGFISCPLGQSFSDRNFCWNLFPTKRRLLDEK